LLHAAGDALAGSKKMMSCAAELGATNKYTTLTIINKNNTNNNTKNHYYCKFRL
jgi:hypothetical protein